MKIQSSENAHGINQNQINYFKEEKTNESKNNYVAGDVVKVN